ncbi:MAG: hypothetical protein JW969_20925 [Spirochaetales bacterium]|nr:hypothetical protein [Spirochaetales bacterium]
MKKIFYICIVLFVILLTGCLSTPEDKLGQTIEGQDYKNIEEIELILLDYKFGMDPAKLEAASSKLKGLFASESYNKEYESVLYGIAGMIAYYNGKTVEVKKNIEMAVSKDSANEYIFILKGLSEKVIGKRVEIMEEGLKTASNKALLQIYLAELYYDLGLFNKATASFDEGLNVLHPNYRKYYQKKRDLSYQFISNPPNTLENIDILSVDSLTFKQLITLVLGSTDYLDYVWPYKNADINVVFGRLKETGYVPASASNPDQILLRKDCAYFLLHIISYLEKDDKILNQYSKQYIINKQASPIPDVRVEDYFFNAVLVCVEREIMNLMDGINFKPDKTVSGIEFNEILKKMKVRY